MGFEGPIGAVTNRSDYVGPKRQVWHKAAVHHVELEAVDACLMQGKDLVTKSTKVGWEN
jgi:hypothetical protein